MMVFDDDDDDEGDNVADRDVEDENIEDDDVEDDEVQDDDVKEERDDDAEHEEAQTLFCEDGSITLLGDGDWDGNKLWFCSDPDLTSLLRATPDGRACPYMQFAEEDGGNLRGLIVLYSLHEEK